MLRITHYNIFRGGKDRLEKVSKVIEDINPDICGILEAVDWEANSKKIKEFAENLGFDSFEVAQANSVYNLAVLSKVPIRVTGLRKGMQHVALQVVVEGGEFKDTAVFFVHLSPVSEDVRLLEIEEIMNHATKNNSIIMGDFNSLSPHDPYNKKELLNTFRKKQIRKYGESELRFDVIEEIERSGYVDAASYLNHPFTTSVPTAFNIDPSHETPLRIDYAFVSEHLAPSLRGAETHKTRHAEKASDHYPLSIDLERS